MKKLTYLFAALVMVAALGSCEQDDSEIVLKKGATGFYLPPVIQSVAELSPLLSKDQITEEM